MIKKTIQSFTEYGVKFTEDECEKLGIVEGDKFSIDITDDGVLLKKYKNLELDLQDLSREVLEFLVKESCEKDITVSQVIENILEVFLKNESSG